MNDKNHHILCEYNCLFIEKEGISVKKAGDIGISESLFREIETFVKKSKKDDIFALIPSFKSGYGDILQAQQFVGVIETKSGTVIEILPKITEEQNEEMTRGVFLKMLSKLKDSPFKNLDKTSLRSRKWHLLEIFIAMFLDELAELIKKGMRADYITCAENSPFLKGKLKLKEQLKYNLIHQERFFVEFDEYSVNRPENRLIKSTLQFLYKKSQQLKNQQRIREFLFVFDEVHLSKDIKKDFSKVQENRQMKHYQTIMKWCEIFLNQKSFTSFQGDSVAVSLLFDMNKIFENYVHYHLNRKHPGQVRAQVGEKHLVVSPKRLWKLKPDLLIKENIIADTKWKIFAKEKDISQADLYQMFAYGKKYHRSEIWLIYPKNKDFQVSWDQTYLFEENPERLSLKVRCFDCESGRLLDGEVI